jgi:DNA end-binding protein Ku
MRALWRGVIQLGQQSVPVKLYAAVQPHAQISFTLLHAADKTPLKQVMVNSVTGETVPRELMVKGYPLTKRKLVPVDPADIEALAPEGDRDIEVLACVDPAEIDPRYYVRPYFVGPDTRAERELAVLRAALEQSGTAAICRWVMRRIQYTGALMPEGGALKLVTLRQPEQVLHRQQSYADVRLDARELKTARYLVEALTGSFTPEEYTDEYRARVEELIERKAKGLAVPKQVERAARTRSGELLELLEASLKAAKGETGAAKRPAAKKTAPKTTERRRQRGA